MLFNCFLNLVHTGWLVYGNIIFYKYHSQCEDEMTRNTPDSDSAHMFISSLLGLIILGYIPMLKCCTIGSLLVCFGPALYRAIRRQGRADA